MGPWFFTETSNEFFLKVCGGSWPCGHHSLIHWMVRWEILKPKRGPESNVAHGKVFRKQLWIEDIHVNPKWITNIKVFILNGFHTATLHRFQMNCLTMLFGDTGGSDSHWCESIHAGEAMGLSKWQANSRLYTRPCIYRCHAWWTSSVRLWVVKQDDARYICCHVSRLGDHSL